MVNRGASSGIRPWCLLPGRPSYLTGQQVDKSRTRRTQIQLNNRLLWLQIPCGLKVSWISLVEDVSWLKVTGRLTKTWEMLLLFALARSVISRDRHMLRRPWASWALDGLRYVPAHALISENETLELLSTYILLHFLRNMLNIHSAQAPWNTSQKSQHVIITHIK